MTSNHRLLKPCCECGETFETARTDKDFCDVRCRKDYNNRRAVRGAELYDVLMAMRFDRDYARDQALFSQLCSMASAYNEADREHRKGRKSYDKLAHTRLPLAYGKGGDQRR